jgi:hypothetical protein
MSTSTTERHEFFHSLRVRTILTAVGLAALYLLSLWLAMNEAERRSISLQSQPQGADHLIMDVNVVHVDPLRSEMTTRISFRLAGKLAQNEVTLANDLQLILNTVHGQQQFNFVKGNRINPIEAVFPLQGEPNLYPFDHYTGTMWFLVTIPEKQKDSGKQNSSKKQAGSPSHKNVPKALTESAALPVGTSDLMERAQADTGINFNASISGLSFRGSNVVEGTESMKGLSGIQVQLRRSLNVMIISLSSMLMMAALAVGLVAMVLKIVDGTRRMANFHVPMSVSLIFGLPALRNMQPGIPPIGTFGDTVAFTWAELAAAGSAIALVIHWLLRPSTPPTGPS